LYKRVMNDRYRERIPQGLGEIAGLLHNRRPEAGPLDLDRIKLRAKAQGKAARRLPALQFGKGNGFMRSRVVSLLLVTGLLGGGTGALAAVGGPPFDVLSNNEGASNSQYCPPTSQQPGKPKKPGPARCGNPQTKDPPGHENGGPGNGHGNGNGNAYGQGNGHGNGHGNGEVKSQGNSPGNGHGNGGGHGNGAGKGNGKKK
jgi:hypothetical protein